MHLTKIILVGLVIGTLAVAGCAARRARRSPPAAAVAQTGMESAQAQAAKKAGKKSARGAAAPARPAAVVAAPKAPAGNAMEWAVDGWGPDQPQAEQDAIEHLLDRQQPSWTIAPSEVQKRLVLKGAERHDELDVDLGAGAKLKCWTVTLAINPQDYQDLLRLDREARHKRLRAVRMEWLAKGLAVVLAGLVAVLVFIRVGQWASGLWTRRVRLVVACLLVAAVAGLLCLS